MSTHNGKGTRTIGSHVLAGYDAVQAKNDYVVMRIHEHEGTASGLIALPEAFRQGVPPTAEVVSVGERVTSCKAGDLVYCAARPYQPVRMGNETLYVCTCDSILLVITEPGPQWTRQIERAAKERERQMTIDAEVEGNAGIVAAS